MSVYSIAAEIFLTHSLAPSRTLAIKNIYKKPQVSPAHSASLRKGDILALGTSRGTEQSRMKQQNRTEPRRKQVPFFLLLYPVSQRHPNDKHTRRKRAEPIPRRPRRRSALLGSGGGGRRGGGAHGARVVTLVIRQWDDGEATDDVSLGVLDGLRHGGLGDGHDLPDGRGRDAVVDERLGSGGDGGEREVAVEGAGGDERVGALGRWSGGALLGGETLQGGHVQAAELLLQRGVVREQVGGAVAVDVDEAEVGSLLRELVHHAAGEHGGHQGPVDDGHLGEDARGGHVAAILAEEDGHAGAREVRHQHVVAGGFEGRVAAPRVAVQREDVDARRVRVVARRRAL